MFRIPNGTQVTWRSSDKIRAWPVWTGEVVALVAVAGGADYYIVATYKRNHQDVTPRYKYPRAANLERQQPHLVKTYSPTANSGNLGGVMFYVYYGYVSPDNCDSSENLTHKIREFRSSEEVIAFKQEFEEELPRECSHVAFRVFEGRERPLLPKQVVQTYELG